MAGPTMAELITQVRQRSELENSAFVTDQELEDYLNDSIAELHAELMARWGDWYFVDQEEVTVTGGAGDEDGNIVSIVPTPFDFPPLRFYAVTLYDPGENRLIPLHQFNARDTVIDLTPSDWITSPPRYRVIGDSDIEFDRASSVDQTVMVRVVRGPSRYDKDTAIVIDELYSWREFVIVDTMIKVFQKEESDTAALDARKMALLGRISANAPPRDATTVKFINDDRSLQGGDDWGW